MRLMGIEAIYPKKSLSGPSFSHKIYSYLLRVRELNEINEIWSADITYIRIKHGWLYLVAIIDWISPFVLSFKLSTTLEVPFCIRALERALMIGTPKIFDSDQGSWVYQFSLSEMLRKKRHPNQHGW